MHNSVTEKLNDIIKGLYHNAVEADQQLVALRNKGQAKFSQVLSNDSLFITHADHFMPYVAELSEDLEIVSTASEQEYQRLLARLVNKIKQLTDTLTQFMAVI